MMNMNGTMMKVMLPNENDEIKMLQFSEFNRHCNIFHFVTTRYGGVSVGNYASSNTSEYCGDNPETVSYNRKLICDLVKISPESLFVAYQVHGCSILNIDRNFLSLSNNEQKKRLHGVDALVTNLPGYCVAVTTADCVPILLYDVNKKVVAAVHAGWRGTVQQIAVKTVQIMQELYFCSPDDIRAGIGPSIGLNAFEVGEEVVDAFRMLGIKMELISVRNVQTGKTHIDLWEANRIQLMNTGLRDCNIEIAGICTYSHSEDFFSARRLGIHSGRILSGIGIKKEE